MLLPGGLFRDGTRRRRAALKPPDGWLELALARQASSNRSLPARVSAVLAAVLDSIDGEPADVALAEQLCVADRQFLMHRVAECIGMDRAWRTAVCGGCETDFDFQVNFADLPVREAGERFPYAEVATSTGPLRLRVPTGADQTAVTEIPDPKRAERSLFARCVVEPAGLDIDALMPDDFARVENALEEVSPAVVTQVAAACPACGHVQGVELDPYVALRRPATESVLEDVHLLASAYHWSERDILALPRERRQFYLTRVDRAQGRAT